MTSTARLIYIYSNASAAAVAENPRFVVHETGHAFEKALREALPRQRLGREYIDTEYLWSRNGQGTSGFAGGLWDWQWSRQDGPLNLEDNTDGRGEIFADMFIGWVYNQWEMNSTGSGWTELGQARADLMSSRVPDWIFDAINRRLEGRTP
jgi:hypothetical protein